MIRACEEKGLPVDGTKQDLVAALTQHVVHASLLDKDDKSVTTKFSQLDEQIRIRTDVLTSLQEDDRYGCGVITGLLLFAFCLRVVSCIAL